MSQEILKALMQLFAIISKQDDGINAEKRAFVRSFLELQLNEEKVEEYYLLFEEHLKDKRKKKKKEGKEEKEEKNLTSVTDSVRTLGICKRINKSLTQKQKIIVLVRLFELINVDRIFSKQRIDIIDTASKVFKIEGDEYKAIEQFVISNELKDQDADNVLLVSAKIPEGCDDRKNILYNNLNGSLFLLRIQSVNLYFVRFVGDIQVYLNGNVLSGKRIYLLASGSSIRLPVGKPLYYSEIAHQFIERSEEISISFDAKDIEYKFPNGNVGLRGINIAEREGNLVGIMGSSGAGKTTLLNILSGIESPSSGKVLINNQELHSTTSQLDGAIGFVPQDDLLFEELTVFHNLYFSAKLCYKNLKEKELTNLVHRVLGSLGLLETKDLKVGNVMNKTISGGQRKRLNIGLELIREPAILFLDEPTSGLSSRDSENVMDLLRELAFKGKLIFVVIHQPSSEIYKMFDKIVLLDTGGYQVYYGNPVEAVSYFKKIDQQINSEAGECVTCGNVNPETMFNVIESKEVDEYGNLSDSRKVQPKRWGKIFEKDIVIPKIDTVLNAPPKTFDLRNRFQQFLIFFQRDFLSKVSNRQYMLLNLLESPVLAFFLSFIIRYISNPEKGVYLYRENDNIPAYIFMGIIVSMFIGLTVSAEEIFRDREIRKREEFLNLSRLSYLFSKAAILFILSAVQSLLFIVVGNLTLELKGMYLEFWLMLFTISFLANIIGLIISSSFNSAVTIYIIIPLLVIPQLILGGAMFNYNKLNRLIGGGVENDVPLIADFMPSRWAYEGLVVDVFINNEYGKKFYELEMKESKYSYKQSFYIPLLKDLMRNSKMFLLEDNLLQAKENIAILGTEIAKENSINSVVKFNKPERITIDNLSEALYREIGVYLKELNNFYSITFNGVTAKKEQLKMEINSENRSAFNELKDNYFNDNSSEILTSSLEKKKIILYDKNVKQIIDPIYLIPDKGNFLDLNVHFYAPKKNLFSNLISTFWFNIIVLWTITVILFLLLYYDVAKLFGVVSSKLSSIIKLNKR